MSDPRALLDHVRADLVADAASLKRQARTVATVLARELDSVAVVWTRRGDLLIADAIAVPDSGRGASFQTLLASRPIDARTGLLARVLRPEGGLAPPLDTPFHLGALWGPNPDADQPGPVIQDLLLSILPGREAARGVIAVLLPADAADHTPLDDQLFYDVCQECAVHLASAWERRRLEVRNARLLRVNTDLRRYAHLVSHDLKEPVRTMGGLAALLQRRYGEQLDDKANEWMSLMVDGADRARQLIEGMLSFAEFDENLELSAVDVDAVIDDVFDDLAVRAAEVGASIERSEMPTLVADGTQLRRVFTNLIKNALNATVEGRPPVIRIHAEDNGEEWVFTVEDNGHGFDNDIGDQLFHRFYSKDEDGSGVGLTVVQRILQGHGGRVWAESEPDVRTAFHFAIPHDVGVYLDTLPVSMDEQA